MSETSPDSVAPGDAVQDDDAPTGVSRRTAVKVAAAAGVGAVVWAEPTIKGLARRPAYAENGSGVSSTPVTISGTIVGGAIDAMSLSAIPTAVGGETIQLSVVFSNNGLKPRILLGPNNVLLFDSMAAVTGDTGLLETGNNTHNFNNSRKRLQFRELTSPADDGPFMVSLSICEP